MKKSLKYFLIVLTILIIPVLIAILVLYLNNGFYLKKFYVWISEPGNLSAFIAICVSYLPVVTFFWNVVILSFKSRFISNSLKKQKQEKSICIYNDEKENYIFWDKENNKIQVSLKSPQSCSAEELAQQMYVEVKEKIKQYRLTQKSE